MLAIGFKPEAINARVPDIEKKVSATTRPVRSVWLVLGRMLTTCTPARSVRSTA